MRTLAYPLCIAAFGCAAFSYWGLNTVAGRRAFDEMAGIIPLAAGVLSAPLLLLAVFLWWLSEKKK